MELQEKANNNIARSLWRIELIYAMLTTWGNLLLQIAPPKSVLRGSSTETQLPAEIRKTFL